MFNNNNEDLLPFNVMRGSEAALFKEPDKFQNGTLYFTTDTKKIYMDMSDQRLPMGGSTGIYYANYQFEEEVLDFIFALNDLNSNILPNIDDLILNIADGCFYRVVKIFTDSVETEKLTIAGNSSEIAKGSVDVTLISPLNNSTNTIVVGKPYNIQFNFSAVNEKNEPTGFGRYELFINGAKEESGSIQQGPNTLEIGKYFNTISTYEVVLYCYGDNGEGEKQRKQQFTVISTAFNIEWDHKDDRIHYLNEDFQINWSVTAEAKKIISYIKIDNKYILPSIINETKLTIPADKLQDYKLEHGAHKFELYTEAYIGDEKEPVISDPIVKNIIFYDNSKPDEELDFIIICNLFETSVKQYDTIHLPVKIYHPNNIDGTATIQIKVGNKNYTSRDNCKNFVQEDFFYTPTTSGLITLMIIVNGTSKYQITLNAESLPFQKEEVEGAIFTFKPSLFADDKSVQQWKYTDNGIDQRIKFSENFDWINGGLRIENDEEGPYFKIQAGSQMTIPFQMFKQDSKLTGANFKFIFKATNCRDYDAEVLKCINTEVFLEQLKDEGGNLLWEKNDSGEFLLDENNQKIPTMGRVSKDIGLKIQAQSSEMRSQSNTLSVQFCENTYIEYEFDIGKYNSADKGSQLLTIWIDGIPAVVDKFSEGDSFKQTSAPQDIVIGSEDCDVQIYLIKYYNKHLEPMEHLDNFIMDAPTSNEMISRFTRNNVITKDISNNEYISPELVAKNNPNCNIYIYDLPNIPTKKFKEDTKQYVEGTFKQLKGSSIAFNNYDVKVAAQGTSSMDYGKAAFNLDTKFPVNIELDAEAIPVNYLNTKVNVASCEGANNALNQEWYNIHQPYKTQKRLQQRSDGKIARDTMEFKPGIVFIKDNNSVINDEPIKNNLFKEIPGYVNNPYPRLYAIGCMGNSKKNTEVFHGAGNQYECCVENKDNNDSAHRMLFISGKFSKKSYNGIEVPDHEVQLDLPDSMFNKEGFVIPDADWGTTLDPVCVKAGWPEDVCRLDNKSLWEESLIHKGFYDFRYIKDEEDFQPNDEFNSYEKYRETLSNNFLRLVRWFAKNNPYNATDRELTPEEIEFVSKPYKILGVKKTAYSNYNETEVLAGLEVPGIPEVKKDTPEYRVAKMLRESEQYVILDSLVYHYIFIERHTMVDNVAKNTFWNTENGKHWELTKNYDNDTADGVDNDGRLVFAYGSEIMDNQSNGAAIFNARPSAWLHFIHGLVPLQEAMYGYLNNISTWSSTEYLKAFNEWQSSIPEICWIEDFNRKYIRPYTLYNDSTYLNRLANGKKTHQRKQYETYQEQYLNSKYKTNTGEASSISWRSEQPVDDSAKNDEGKYEIAANVKLYADGYITLAIAAGAGEQSAINIHKRAKRGETIPISKEGESPYGNATCFIYSPNLYQEISGVEALYPAYFKASEANKLTVFSFDPTKDIQKGIFSGELSLPSSIEEITFKNCHSIDNDLDLSACNRLKKLNTLGSNFTTYTIADGAPLSIFKIERPTSLTLSNLRYLNKIDKQGNECFKINNYGRLRIINLNTIDFENNDITDLITIKVNSKDILKEILNILPENQKFEYALNNVKWIFDENDEITDQSISLLDNLLASGDPIKNKKPEEVLSGNAKILHTAYSGPNSLQLYEKYGLKKENGNSYPNLTLNFMDENQKQKLYTITIKSGDGVIKWERQYQTFNNISNNDLEESSYGKFNPNTAINKDNTWDQTYKFLNKWLVTIKNTEKTIEMIGEDETFKYLDLSKIPLLFESLGMGESWADITIEPCYESFPLLYKILFKNSDEEVAFYEAQALYGTPLKDIMPPFIPIKDDSNLSNLEQTYKFIGYVEEDTKVLIDEDTWAVEQDITLCPVFETVDIYDIDFSEYLDITEENTLKGLVKKDGNIIYQGKKIVIPKHVSKINDGAFQDNNTLRQVLIEDNSQLQSIGQDAFYNSQIDYFDFSKCHSLKKIGYQAFRGVRFQGKYYNGYMIFPEGLERIEKYAFNIGDNQTFADSPNMKIYIPSSVTYLGEYAFAHFGTSAENVIIQIGSESNPSQLDLNNNIYFTSPIFGSYRTGPNNYTDICEIWFYTKKYTEKTELNKKLIKDILRLSTSFIQVYFPLESSAQI